MKMHVLLLYTFATGQFCYSQDVTVKIVESVKSISTKESDVQIVMFLNDTPLREHAPLCIKRAKNDYDSESFIINSEKLKFRNTIVKEIPKADILDLEDKAIIKFLETIKAMEGAVTDNQDVTDVLALGIINKVSASDVRLYKIRLSEKQAAVLYSTLISLCDSSHRDKIKMLTSHYHNTVREKYRIKSN